jgi:hypothetical protein
LALGLHLGLHLGLNLGGEPGDLGRVLAREPVLALGERLDDPFEREPGPLKLGLDDETLDEVERVLHRQLVFDAQGGGHCDDQLGHLPLGQVARLGLDVLRPHLHAMRIAIRDALRDAFKGSTCCASTCMHGSTRSEGVSDHPM